MAVSLQAETTTPQTKRLPKDTGWEGGRHQHTGAGQPLSSCRQPAEDRSNISQQISYTHAYTNTHLSTHSSHLPRASGSLISAGPAKVTPPFGTEHPAADSHHELGKSRPKAEPRSYSRSQKRPSSLPSYPASGTALHPNPDPPSAASLRALYILPALRLTHSHTQTIASHTRGTFALQAIFLPCAPRNKEYSIPATTTTTTKCHGCVFTAAPGFMRGNRHHHYNYDRDCSCTRSARRFSPLSTLLILIGKKKEQQESY